MRFIYGMSQSHNEKTTTKQYIPPNQQKTGAAHRSFAFYLILKSCADLRKPVFYSRISVILQVSFIFTVHGGDSGNLFFCGITAAASIASLIKTYIVFRPTFVL